MIKMSLWKSSVALAGLLLTQAVTFSARGQGELVLSNKWSVGALARSYLGTNSNFPRCAMINRVTGHVLIPTTSPTNQVWVLNGIDGSDLGSLNTSGITGGHTAAYSMLMGGVADDGVIYVGNLEVNTTVFRIWRWAAEDPNVAPQCVFGPADPGPVQTRIGDALCVRGAGAKTQIIASGTGSSYFTVFTTADGTNFTAHQITLPTGVAAGDAKRGVAFDGTNDAFYAGVNANSAIVHHIGFDLTTGTSTLLEDITLPNMPMGCLSVTTLSGFKVLAGVHDTGYAGSMHTLDVYDITQPGAPVLADNGETAFPGTAALDGNATGSSEFGAGMLVALNTHNGLLALSVAVVTNPPSFVMQPQDRTAFPGGSATFSVKATGTKPLAYQWYKNGATLLQDQTDNTLTLPNVQPGDAGTYSVVVSNVVAAVPSSGAKLTVSTPMGYAATVVADKPLAYWRLGEAGGPLARDVWGAHDGTYVSATLGLSGYSLIDPDTSIGVSSLNPGGVSVADNSAFNFTGSTPAFTLEAWVNFKDFQGVQRLFSDVDYSVVGAGSGIGFGLVDANTMRFTTYGVQDFDLPLTGIGPLVAGRWYHIVGVADGNGTFNFYLNGQQVGAIPFNGAAVGSTQPFWLGRTPYANEAVNGQIDELAVYGTALTSDQVLAHYTARYGANTPPQVRQQPSGVTNYAGLNAVFSVVAEGSGTLAYQWLKDGVEIQDQTTDTLILNPLGATSAGNYSVRITGVGSTTTPPVHLTVLPVPAAIDLSPGLVLHLKFDGDYLDYSGRGNNGTNVGATFFVTDGKIGGQALHVSTDTGTASYNYVTLGLRPDLEFGSNTDFSAAYWVRLPGGSMPGDLPFLCNAVGSGRGFGYVFCPSYQAGGWRWTLYNNTGTGVNCVGDYQSINDGNWHHVAQTFERAGNGVTYLDGIQVSSVAIAAVGNLDSGQPTNIGQDPTGTYAESGEFDLDDMGVWRRALTPLEVAGMYVAGASNGVNFASAPVRIQAQATSGQVRLTWSGGLLQAADQVVGPYSDVNGANSPYSIAPAGAKKFYRVRQ